MGKCIKGLIIIVFAITSLTFVSSANAVLIVDITGVPGSGETLWSFSGSTTAVGTGFFEDGNGIGNSDSWQNVGNYTSINDFEVTTVFGVASLTIAGITRSIDLAYIDNDNNSLDDFGVGVSGASNFDFADGDLISWMGSLQVVGFDLNDIGLAGIPTTLLASQYGDSANLELEINISEFIFLPEPATAALLAVGLTLLVCVRRRAF